MTNNPTGNNTPTTPLADAYESDPRIAARNRSLSREAAGWRVKYRNAEAENVELKTRLAALEARSNPTNPNVSDVNAAQDDETGNPQRPDADGASPAVDVLAADAVVSGDDDAIVGELIEALATQTLEDAGALFPEDALTLLRARGQLVIGDDDEPRLTIDGKPTAVTADSLARVLRPEMLRASGVAGTGSRSPRPSFAPSSYDPARAARDPRHHIQFRREWIESMRRGR